jgi:DNA-binding XRE family transcriptional regulator
MDLKAARLEKGLTQQEIAKAAGISRSAYTNIENNKRKPAIKTAKKLGAILDFDWPALFDEKPA